MKTALSVNDLDMLWERGVKWKRVLTFVLGNLVPFLLLVYGLKCIIMLSGKLTEPGKYVMGSFYLAPVKGTAAVVTGLGDISFALFGYLSCGTPTTKDHAFLRSVLRQ